MCFFFSKLHGINQGMLLFLVLVECLFESSNWVHVAGHLNLCMFMCMHMFSCKCRCRCLTFVAPVSGLMAELLVVNSSSALSTSSNSRTGLTAPSMQLPMTQSAHPPAGRQSGGQSHGQGWGVCRVALHCTALHCTTLHAKAQITSVPNWLDADLHQCIIANYAQIHYNYPTKAHIS